MGRSIRTLALAILFTSCVALCGVSMAGPINNAQQFQEKAVKSALQTSGNRNLDHNSPGIKWTDKTKAEKHDADKRDIYSFVNVSVGEPTK